MHRKLDLHRTHGKEATKASELVFGDLYQKLEQPLYNLVFRVTKSDQQSRDILQEVFLKLWEHQGRLGDIQCVEAWLYRVTENKLIDFLRKTAADQRLREALWKKTNLSVQETEELLQAKECHSMIHKAVDQLPPQRKLIYRLNREKGLNYQEIADELSISRHTVKNQLSLALHTIQRFLSGLAGLFLLFWNGL